MKKNDVFTFTAPNGAKVIGIVIYRRNLNRNFPNYVQYEYVAYAQNRLFTCTQMERVIDRENYNACPIEYGHVLVDYAILPEYDSLLGNTLPDKPDWEDAQEEAAKHGYGADEDV